MELKCDICGIKVDKLKRLKKLNGGFYCKKCEQKKREEHREFLRRNVLGIKKRKELKKIWEKKRKEKEAAKEKQFIKKQNIQEKPIIKGAKVKIKTRQVHCYLTHDERGFIFKKMLKQGFPEEECKERVSSMVKYLKDYVKGLREQKKKEQEVSRRFNEEFARLIESYA